ncbi:MAG: tetratricopeptide repeat protein, partial [Planctomycetota bacterium]
MWFGKDKGLSNHRTYGDMLLMAGSIVRKEGRINYALELYKRYKGGNWLRRLQCLERSADIYLGLGDKSKALKFYKEALTFSNHERHDKAIGKKLADLKASGLNIILPAGEEGLTLVKDGKSLVPIVVFKDAPPYTKRAADELAEYLKKISGANVEVISGTPDSLPESAIWVGYQEVLDKLFPKIDFKFKKAEEILVSANDKHLVIA